MEEWIEKFGWKKIAVVIIIGCLLLLGFVVLSFMNMDRQQTEIIKKNIEKNKLESNGGSSSSGGFVDTPFKPFSNQDYSLSYPKNLTVKQVTPTDGATSSVLFTDVNLNTNILIEVYPKPQFSYEAAIKPYVLKSTDVEKLPLKFDDNAEFFLNNPNNPMMHNTLIFVDKKDKFFRISFEYSGSEFDADTERNFAKMTDSMR